MYSFKKELLAGKWLEARVFLFVIIRLRQRGQATGRKLGLQRYGWTKVATPREDCFIQRQATQNAIVDVNQHRQQAATNTVVSGRTIRNRLNDFNSNAGRPFRRLTLIINRRSDNRVWCIQQRVLFIGKSRFYLQPADGCARVWRRRGERFKVVAVMKRHFIGGGSCYRMWRNQCTSWDIILPCSGQLTIATGMRLCSP